MGNVSGKEIGASRSRSTSLSSLRLGGSFGDNNRSGSIISEELAASEVSSVVSSAASSRRGVRAVISLAKSKLSHNDSGSLVYDPNEIVDGGYLVPQGVYKGAITYKEKIVRQLMVDRRLAPFYKGIPDIEESWNDRQLLAAVRGLPIPQCEPEPPDVSESAATSRASTFETTVSEPPPRRRLSDVTLPTKGTSIRTGSSDEDRRSDHEGLQDIDALKADSVHVEEVQLPSSTPVANRSRAHTTSKYGPGNPSSSPPLEVLLYRDAIECPICFLYYPKYVNFTRCCSQPICSECFLQIKRSDPHPPVHSPATDTSNPSCTTSTASIASSSTPSASSSSLRDEPPSLVSDPACCPFCTEADFGVYYIPGPHRSGIGRSKRLPTVAPRRRGSLPPNAPEVVTTDRIRPDWAIKLSAARQHLARKSAAANALHATAFMMDGSADSASHRKKDRKKRPSRLRALQSSLSSSPSSTPSGRLALTERFPNGRSAGASGAMAEELMIVEAIRLSLYEQNGSTNDSAGTSKRVGRDLETERVRAVI